MDRESLLALADACEEELQPVFRRIERVSLENTDRVLRAFRDRRVSEACFAGTTGYGYDDLGRETLEHVYADVFGAESALVRIQFVNGTHAIACALYGALAPGDTMLSVTGAPYDTLHQVITGNGHGSLAAYGVRYREIGMAPDGGADLAAIRKEVSELQPKAVYIQRSRGYAGRRALSVDEIGEIVRSVRELSPESVVIVDNCYGEFTETKEPTHAGADLIAGSLIKNPGGGLAPSGGYVCGREELVARAAERLTVPGIGGECGATFGANRSLFQGFFMAPHAVAQALKTAVFSARMLEKLGFSTSPSADGPRSDVIQTIRLGNAENLLRFCSGIQKGSPVDSFVTPVADNMPGYDSKVVMAAGTFIQGSSIELSADGPMREPYYCFLQGGLTYEAGRLGVLRALEEMICRG